MALRIAHKNTQSPRTVLRAGKEQNVQHRVLRIERAALRSVKVNFHFFVVTAKKSKEPKGFLLFQISHTMSATNENITVANEQQPQAEARAVPVSSIAPVEVSGSEKSGTVDVAAAAADYIDNTTTITTTTTTEVAKSSEPELTTTATATEDAAAAAAADDDAPAPAPFHPPSPALAAAVADVAVTPAHDPAPAPDPAIVDASQVPQALISSSTSPSAAAAAADLKAANQPQEEGAAAAAAATENTAAAASTAAAAAVVPLVPFTSTEAAAAPEVTLPDERFTGTAKEGGWNGWKRPPLSVCTPEDFMLDFMRFCDSRGDDWEVVWDTLDNSMRRSGRPMDALGFYKEICERGGFVSRESAKRWGSPAVMSVQFAFTPQHTSTQLSVSSHTTTDRLVKE